MHRYCIAGASVCPLALHTVCEVMAEPDVNRAGQRMRMRMRMRMRSY